MKKKSLSRRKFLTGMGLAAGSAALLPNVKTLNADSKGKRSLLDAWTKPTSAYDRNIHPVRTLSRKPGSHLLALAQRPF
jgi:hypothetical protein